MITKKVKITAYIYNRFKDKYEMRIIIGYGDFYSMEDLMIMAEEYAPNHYDIHNILNFEVTNNITIGD